jgi:hypothetical protein
MNDVGLEFLKASLAMVVAAVSLFLGSVVGRYLNNQWDDVRRQREQDLAALDRFYGLYGEFFAVWKEWSTARPRTGEKYIQPPEAVAWSLLQRASAVEGGFEALLVKLSLERNLDEPQLETLARFRQSYQSLRESIRTGQRLEWRGSPGQGDASAQYLAFKHLAADFAQLLADQRTGPPAKPGAAGATLEAATKVESRNSWWVLP